MSPHATIRVYRAELLESEHRLSYAVVEEDRLVRSAGDPGRVTFFRSGAKPIQALAAIETGAAAAYGLTPLEIAATVGSHNGEERHVRAARSILAKAGIPEEALQCGPHPPAGDRARDALAAAGELPLPIHNNCSGKHAGMLCAAKHTGESLTDYLDPEHPVQMRNRANISLFTGLPEDEVVIGVDGCSAPVFGVPLVSMARAFARLTNPDRLDAAKEAAVRTITDAVAAHPEMVAGEDRNDTELMLATGGRMLAKIGAEGLWIIGVKKRKLGIAVKVMDGTSRAHQWLMPALLRDLGVLSASEEEQFGKWADRTVTNCRERTVGRVEVDLR